MKFLSARAAAPASFVGEIARSSAFSALMRAWSSLLNGATSTAWLRANVVRAALSASASCSVENIAVTWRASSLPNATDSMRARQTRSVIASVRTTSFSVLMRLLKLLPVPMREVW